MGQFEIVPLVAALYGKGFGRRFERTFDQLSGELDVLGGIIHHGAGFVHYLQSLFVLNLHTLFRQDAERFFIYPIDFIFSEKPKLEAVLHDYSPLLSELL